MHIELFRVFSRFLLPQDRPLIFQNETQTNPLFAIADSIEILEQELKHTARIDHFAIHDKFPVCNRIQDKER